MASERQGVPDSRDGSSMAQTGDREGLFAPALAGSLIAHAAFAGALALSMASPGPAGGGGAVLEAISVEVVEGRALDARAEARPPDVSSAPASVAEREGGAVETASVASTVPAEEDTPDRRDTGAPVAARPEAQRAESEPEPPTREPGRIELSALALSPLAPAVMPELPQPEPARPPDPAPPTARAAAQASVAMAHGGASSRASDGAEGTASAGASPGEINRYAGLISREVNNVMRKLAPAGRRGSLRLVFTVREDGAVSEAQITEPSGDRALDALVLQLIQGLSLPEPPSRMTAAQRTYAVPIRVR